MAMVQNYIKSSLKIVVAQICHNMGWHAIQTTPLELLVDILHRYLEELGKTAHRYSEQFGRTEPNLDDLGLAFKDIGVLLVELEDFVNNVEPVPFVQDIPKIPVARPNRLQYPKQGSREVLTRPEWIDEHLPVMNPEAEDEMIESPSTSVDFNGKSGGSSSEIVDGTAQGLRRPLEAIGTNGVPFKRPRLFADDEGCPMRDGSCVSLTVTGDIALDGHRANVKAPKFFDDIRSSSSSHSPEQAAVEGSDAWKDGKKEPKKTDKVRLKNRKDKGKIVKKKNGKKEKVKNSSKKNKDKNKEGKKLKLMTDSILNNVGRGPDGKFKKMKMKIPKSKPLIIKTKKGLNKGTADKTNKSKKKIQILGVPPSFLPSPKLPKTPKASKSSSSTPKAPKAPKSEKHPSPLAQLATFLSKAGSREQQLGDNSPLDLGVSMKSEVSQGFSGEDSPERLIIDDNPAAAESKERESRLAAFNDSINAVIMKGLEETARDREESSRSYHETIEDVIRQGALETPVKSEPREPRDVYDFTDDEMSPPATPEGLTSPPKKKQRLEPAEMGKKVRDKIKEKIKSREAKPKARQSAPKVKTEEADEPHDYSMTAEAAPRVANPSPEHDNGVSFQAPYPQMLHLPYFSHIPKVPPALLPYPPLPPMPSPFQSHIPPNMPMPPMGFYVRNPRPETGNFRFSEALTNPVHSTPVPPLQLPPPPPMEFKKLDAFVQPNLDVVEEIDKVKACVVKKEKSEEGEEKLKSKKKKEKGKEKKKGGEASAEKSAGKSGKGSKEKAAKSKDKSKKTEKKKKEDKVKDDSASTVPRITLKLGGNAAQSEGTKIVLKLKLPKPIPTSPFAASLPAPVFQQASCAKASSTAATATPAAHAQTASACEAFAAEHESDSSSSSIQPSLNPNYDTDSSIPSSECGSVTSYSVPSSPVVVAPPELPLSDAVKASAVTDEDMVAPPQLGAQEKSEWNASSSLPAYCSSCPIPAPLPAPLPNDDLRVIKPLAPREIVQSSDSSSPTTDILSTTPKSHPKPQSKVNPVPLPAKAVSATVSAAHSAPARTVITETIGTIIDEQGNKIWICPACTRPDDGSPMIGCDECDDWYHWVCVGIVVPPKEEENWFCSRCIVKKQGLQKKKKKKHRKDKIDL